MQTQTCLEVEALIHRRHQAMADAMHFREFMRRTSTANNIHDDAHATTHVVASDAINPMRGRMARLAPRRDEDQKDREARAVNKAKQKQPSKYLGAVRLY
jgi:hypothetical protein